MSGKLRGVLAGCGGISGGWFRSLASLADRVELVGLVDLDEARARKRAEEFGLGEAAVGTDLERILDGTKPDIVFDCTVPEAHVDVALAALGHGCHVLGEKPLADSMENARRITAAAKAAGRVHAVMQNRRHMPSIDRYRRAVQSGQFGPLTTLNADFYLGVHFGGFRDRMEHVLLLDMAIHTFDEARFISGAEPEAVYCREWNPAGSWYDHDASAVAVFQMSGGLVYTYRGSWCAEGMSTSWESEWRAVGERGTILWDGGEGLRGQIVTEAEGKRRALADAEIPPVTPDLRGGGHAGLIRDFIEAIETGRTPETVCTDNIKSLAMVFGAIDSAACGREVAIEC